MPGLKSLRLSINYAKKDEEIVTAKEWNAMLEELDSVFNQLAITVSNYGSTVYQETVSGPLNNYRIPETRHGRGKTPIIKTYINTSYNTWTEVYDNPESTEDGDIIFNTNWTGKYLIVIR